MLYGVVFYDTGDEDKKLYTYSTPRNMLDCSVMQKLINLRL
jgi:hypothetical protein